MSGTVKQYKTRYEVTRAHRRALRAVAHGASLADAAALAPCHPDTLGRIMRTKGGRDYLAHHRDQVDAHRVLLAATLPYLDLARAVAKGVKPAKRDAGAVEREGEG